jgi:hypothetical protein
MLLLVGLHWISGTDQIICTICAACAGAFPFDFWMGPNYMHHLHLRWLVHLHWISGLDQIICTIGTAFAGAFPLDFWTGPDYMHHWHCICWGISVGFLDWAR